DVGGSFHFDRLMGKSYILVAREGARAAGPVTVRLTAKSEPVTMRLRAAASVEVVVLSATDKHPVAGAQVELRGVETLAGATGRDGRLVFDGVAPGVYSLAAAAPGFAKSFARVRISGQFMAEGVVERRSLELRTGAAVSGRVV